jgi:hypothetical protein
MTICHQCGRNMNNFNVVVCSQKCRTEYDNNVPPSGANVKASQLEHYPHDANKGLRRPYAPYELIT